MLKDKEQFLMRIKSLIEVGGQFSEDNIVASFDSAWMLELQTWLAQADLVVEEALPTRHPFHRQAAAYLAGGGQLGARGMLSLLIALQREIELGTLG